MINKIVEHILQAKMQDLPFSVLKNSVEFSYGPEDFLKYSNYHHRDKGKALDSFQDSCNRNTREDIKDDDLNYFPGWSTVVKDLAKLYGNTDTYYLSLMQTGETFANRVHATLHNDQSDVVHINCFGKVDWLLMDPFDENKTEHRITLEPGDLLYMRGWTLHETTPLTERGSLIFMNLPYVQIPKDLDKENQRRDVMKDLEKDLEEKRFLY
jgi:hypothetical protein